MTETVEKNVRNEDAKMFVDKMNGKREIQQQCDAVFLYSMHTSISSSEAILTVMWSIMSFKHLEPK